MESFAVADVGGKDQRCIAIEREFQVHGFAELEFAGEHHAQSALANRIAASAELGLLIIVAEDDDATVEAEALIAPSLRAGSLSRFGRLGHAWGTDPVI